MRCLEVHLDSSLLCLQAVQSADSSLPPLSGRAGLPYHLHHQEDEHVPVKLNLSNGDGGNPGVAPRQGGQRQAGVGGLVSVLKYSQLY